jgi:hypothetical protein
MAQVKRARGKSYVITDQSFLDDCVGPVRKLFLYGDERRGGRAMPLRADIDPMDFVRHLPGILLVDVRWNPLDFVYRVVGTREVEARGWDATGKPVAGNSFGSSEGRVMESYRYVATAGSYLYDFDPFMTEDGHFFVDESLFLPLSLDGARVDRILVYTHYEDVWHKIPRA